MAALYGVQVATVRVCRGHTAPVDFLADWVYRRPPVSVVHGPRGGGKSFLAGLATHLDGLCRPLHGTRVLGGSLSQSEQIYNALRAFDRASPGTLSSFTKTRAVYTTGAEVSILAASPTSVRGPHVATLRLDEVDEIDPEIREAAAGMCMAQHGVSASIAMTSTWHNVAGPMGELKQRADAGELPWHSFCAFEVLERCSPVRSGKYVGGPDLYEHCPSCPIVRWCHAERDVNGDVPLAKLADGHYAIESLAQKVASVSLRVFEADYLCKGPKADGVWFKGFDPARHVSEAAGYDPALPTHLAIDSGVFTGAVAFQVRPGWPPRVNVFMDFLAENMDAGSVARAIVAKLGGRDISGRIVTTDPAGGARNPIGPTVLALYREHGLGDLRPWPVGSVSDSLATVEGLLDPAGGPPNLLIHPSCKSLVSAMQSYRRAKRSGQWQDYPEDPQHPHEDLIDALRGGLKAVYPKGLQPPTPPLPAVHSHRVLY